MTSMEGMKFDYPITVKDIEFTLFRGNGMIYFCMKYVVFLPITVSDFD